MAREAAEAADGARRQLVTCKPIIVDLVARLLANPPPVIVTCARGSSDHAATYGKYLLETRLGRVVASVGPSIASSYGRAPIGLENALFLAVSQSGRSPDLLHLTEAARAAGALTVGVINDETSPLANACEIVIPMCAGVETSVAATKSFLLAGVALLQLTAAWTNEPALREAVMHAPAALEDAAGLDWSVQLASLARAQSAFVVGRGVGLGAALEVALKLKETCRLHAEAFSTAEIAHGPIALVNPGFPILALGQADETIHGTREVIARLVALGADVRSTVDVEGAAALPTVETYPVLAPLCAVQSFYLAVPGLAAARGVDPDAPPNLTKITRTR